VSYIEAVEIFQRTKQLQSSAWMIWKDKVAYYIRFPVE